MDAMEPMRSESAPKVETKHQQLKSGDSCPKCPNGKVYVLKEPKALIRIGVRTSAHSGDQRTTWNGYERNLCGQVFTAEAPEGVGLDKYDETVGSMVAQLKYGSAACRSADWRSWSRDWACRCRPRRNGRLSRKPRSC